jgi:hypothetical protein
MDMIELAQKRVSELEAELADLRAFLRTYARLAPMTESRPEVNARRRFGAFEINKPKSKKEKIENGVAGILLREGPRMIPDLLTKLTALGIDIGGSDPARTLSSYLSRSPRFKVRLKEGGWFLVDGQNNAPEGGNLPGAQ